MSDDTKLSDTELSDDEFLLVESGKTTTTTTGEITSTSTCTTSSTSVSGEDEVTSPTTIHEEEKEQPEAIPVPDEETFEDAAELVPIDLCVTSPLPALSDIDIFLNAVTAEDIDKVGDMLEQNLIDINCADCHGNTAIILAAKSKNSTLTDLILNQDRVNINYCNDEHCNALMEAARYGNEETVQLLLSRPEMERHIRSCDGESVLSFACAGGYANIVKLLLGYEERIVIDDAEEEEEHLILPGTTLNKSCFDLNFRCNRGYSVLLRAIESQSFETVEILLKYSDIDINGRFLDDNASVLIKASALPSEQIVQLLLAYPNIDANARNTSEETALIVAVKNGLSLNVKWLMQARDIDFNARDALGETALSHSLKFLDVDYDAVVEDTPSSVQHNPREITEILLRNDTRNRIDLNARFANDETVLIAATRKGYDAIVKLILTKPNVDLLARSKFDRTALEEAEMNDNDELATAIQTLNDVTIARQC